MPKSTVHNLLTTLASRGYIEKVDRDHYALGKAIIALTQSVRVNVELRDRAAPLLRELAEIYRETVYLTVLDRDRSLYIYGIESPRRLLARTAIGERVMLHCTSVGKATLAFLPQNEIEEIVGQTGLPAFTAYTITDLETLQEELARIRARGYSTDNQEHELGTFCVGAPIRNERGQVIGSCSLSGPSADIVGARVEEIASRVMYTAQEISRRMGYVPATPASVAAPVRNPSRR